MTYQRHFQKTLTFNGLRFRNYAPSSRVGEDRERMSKS